MRIAVCDDLPVCRQEIIDVVTKGNYFNQSIEWFEFNNGTALLNALPMNYDVVFLDIVLNDSNGIDIGVELRKRNPKVILILVSAYPQYAIAAYECEPLYFLPKPFVDNDLHRVFTKVMQKYHYYHQTYALHTGKQIIPLDIFQTQYVDVYKKHLRFHTTKEVYQEKGSISNIYNQFIPFGFCRVSRSCLVNMHHIKRIDSHDVVLQNNERLLISVRQRPTLMKTFTDFLKKKNLFVTPNMTNESTDEKTAI